MSAMPASISSAMPRETDKPKRRIVTALTVAVTVLALMVTSAPAAHADRSSDDLAKALVAALAIGAIVHSIDKGRADPPRPNQVRSPRLPSVCAIEIAGKRRDVVVYPERCLRREGFDYRLPRHCANDARVFGRTDRVYGESCLRDAGFRTEGQDHRPRGHDHHRPRYNH